jgi:predicted ATP-dependent endonuclease of OLD family
MSEEKLDLSVDGPDSPISFKKFVETVLSLEGSTDFKVLVDNTGNGIASDHEGFMYLTPEEAKAQAVYFKNTLFTDSEIKGKKLPEYLFRYMSMIYQSECRFKNKQELANHINSNPDFYESSQYYRILSLVKNCEYNKEAAQIIGLIMLLAGTFHQCNKDKVSLRILIEEPETHLHPQRVYGLMRMLNEIKKEYLPKKQNQNE